MRTEARTKAGPMVTKIGINWKVNRQAKNRPIENSATCLTVRLKSCPQKGHIVSKKEKVFRILSKFPKSKKSSLERHAEARR